MESVAFTANADLSAYKLCSVIWVRAVPLHSASGRYFQSPSSHPSRDVTRQCIHTGRVGSLPSSIDTSTRNKLTRLLWQYGNPRFQGPMKWPESLHYLCCGSATSDACYKYPLFGPNLDTRQLHDVAVENDVEWNRLI
jgi:hypothetical protein